MFVSSPQKLLSDMLNILKSEGMGFNAGKGLFIFNHFVMFKDGFKE